MKAKPDLIITETADVAAQAVIEDGLSAYNVEKAGFRDWRDLAVLIADSSDQTILGGLLGRTSLGLLFVDLFYLPQDIRSGGIGSRVMRAAETEAIRRGCVSGMLVTISFQAPAFYARHGWQELGRIPCMPPGTSRIVMTKQLAEMSHSV